MMKNGLKTLTKKVLNPLRLNAGASARDVAIHKKNVQIGYDCTCNIKSRNEWYYENR